MPAGSTVASAPVRGLSVDSDGELYLLTSSLTGPLGSTGVVYKIVPPGK